MTLSPPNLIQEIPQKTKYSGNVTEDSCKSSSNSSQALEFNIPDKIANSPSQTTQNSKEGFLSQCDSPLFIVELGVQNQNFANGSGTFSGNSVPIVPSDSGLKISRLFIFRQKSRHLAKSF